MKRLCTIFALLILLPLSAFAQASKIWDDGHIFLRSAYYFEDRSAEGDKVLINALGMAFDIYSGYAWDIVGFDFTGSGTLATGYGN